MKLNKKPWNWDKTTLAFRKHHERGFPRRYRRATSRQIKAAQKQARSSLPSMYATRLAQTIRRVAFRHACEEAGAEYYGHS